ncbi:NAD(P)H-binding protein [Streptomyces sp. NPDC046909]|uniref:NAD(P)H-binding protein n=1 Tax=Streptomyces sp. NPDC046909 TaxID=3155617 RepID=UPI0033F536A7
MSEYANTKPIPRSILVFGANGKTGRLLTDFLHREAPQIELRLSSTKPDGVDALRKDFPYAEAVEANYFDLPSLEAAVEGMEGVFVIATGGTDERTAMTNLVSALKKADSAVHVLRLLGMQPEANPRRIPKAMREAGVGLPVQHPIAKRILDESDLPVTYLNIGAAFTDNFLWMQGGLRSERKLIWNDRKVPFIDRRDIAEVAGRLFLSDNHRHIGQFHTLNNGHDFMRHSDVAELMTEVFGEKITHDGSEEGFYEAYPPLKAFRLWDFFEYERENEVVWALNDFVERTLGRKPITVREWLEENREALLG